MAGAYGTPCSGELQFWSVVQNSMREQTKQLTRIANALEAGHAHEERPPAVDCAKLREALDELVANLERASARDVFSIIDRKVLLDAKAALAATAAELGAAAKKPAAETRVRKVLVVDDFPAMRGYIEKQVPNVEVTYIRQLPEDESVLSQFDALVVDGDGIGNKKWKNGLDFCKSYNKPEGQAVVFHSGLSAYGEDAMILEHRGIANLPKGGNPEKLRLCIRFPMPKRTGGAE